MMRVPISEGDGVMRLKNSDETSLFKLHLCSSIHNPKRVSAFFPIFRRCSFDMNDGHFTMCVVNCGKVDAPENLMTGCSSWHSQERE